jgi:hypothetical protein
MLRATAVGAGKVQRMSIFHQSLASPSNTYPHIGWSSQADEFGSKVRMRQTNHFIFWSRHAPS